ncbi:MAG TPA: GGDEF domain-containing protein, partial [Candidatus Tumulicola sp.]
MKRTRAWDDARLFRVASSLLAVARGSTPQVVDSIAAISGDGDASSAFAVLVVDNDELRCDEVRGSRALAYRGVRVRLDDPASLAARAAANRRYAAYPDSGKPFIVSDRRAVAVPWLDAGRLVAVAYASSLHPAARLPELVPVLAMARTAYLIARERETGRMEADVDELTGLLTARAFRRRLNEEVRIVSARKTPPPMSLWFVDADGFKDVNDRFGHRAGDGVLRTLASLVRSHAVPEFDLAARNGGDEFCLLARATGKARSIERAGALCAAVNRHAFALNGVTASVGVAAFPHDATTANDLLDAADRAMYYSKQTGRNRVSYPLNHGSWASIVPEAAG